MGFMWVVGVEVISWVDMVSLLACSVFVSASQNLSRTSPGSRGRHLTFLLFSSLRD